MNRFFTSKLAAALALASTLLLLGGCSDREAKAPAKPAAAKSEATPKPDAPVKVQTPAPAPDATADKAEHKAITTEKLEPYECGNITKLHTYKGVFLASQPAPEDFDQAKQGGVKTVINLRHAAEQKDFDEAAKIKELGLAYYNPAWNGPDELTDAKFDETRELLRSAERPILLHCASANRVGAMWIAYRVLDDGATLDEAVAEAKIVGLKSPDFETKARDYVARHAAK